MTSPSPIEQFIQKHEELERTMTKGPWRRDGRSLYADAKPTGVFADSGIPMGYGCANLDGIAHLKNSNPTVIAMLKRTFKFASKMLELSDGKLCRSLMTDLNILAAVKRLVKIEEAALECGAALSMTGQCFCSGGFVCSKCKGLKALDTALKEPQ